VAPSGPDVLDVGCGTGIGARQFQAAGCTVLGAELAAVGAAIDKIGGSFTTPHATVAVTARRGPA
jgi:SAM-dependent methyltransferase